MCRQRGGKDYTEKEVVMLAMIRLCSVDLTLKSEKV